MSQQRKWKGPTVAGVPLPFVNQAYDQLTPRQKARLDREANEIGYNVVNRMAYSPVLPAKARRKLTPKAQALARRFMRSL